MPLFKFRRRGLFRKYFTFLYKDRNKDVLLYRLKLLAQGSYYPRTELSKGARGSERVLRVPILGRNIRGQRTLRKFLRF